jgi:predicted ArsR family transcriptional regulator
MSTEHRRTWTFLTNHARVLIIIAGAPDIRLRDVAAQVGITERAAQRIVGDLEADGYLSHERAGRRNHYRLHKDAHLRHPLQNDIEIGRLIDSIANSATSATSPSTP